VGNELATGSGEPYRSHSAVVSRPLRLHQAFGLQLIQRSRHSWLADADRLGELADAQWTETVQCGEYRKVRRRKAYARFLDQHLRLRLQALTDAFQSAAEGQVAERSDDVFNHVDRTVYLA